MRAVKGFDRPSVQWGFVGLAIVLSLLVVSLSVVVWRQNESIRELRAERLNARAEREQLEARLAREQATREALTLELSRVRAGQSPTASTGNPPTLTLQPLARRDATPPDPTVATPEPGQTIELRLVLPRGTDPKRGALELTIRDWVTGQVRLTRGGLKTIAIGGVHAVSAYVAGDVFVPGPYEVILKNGPSEIASYEIAVK